MFAKLFGTDANQVLVKIDSGEDGNPEIRFYCEPEGFGICSAAISFKDDSDNSWKSAEGLFASIDEAKAKTMGEKIRAEIAGISEPNPTGQPPPRLGGGSVAPGCSAPKSKGQNEKDLG